jgi:tetratricopeptide (TPR) repeat protein
MTRVLKAAVAAATVSLLASTAQGAVVVVGGSAAEGCSKAAFASATDQSSLNACNAAITSEGLSRRDLAGTRVNRGVILMLRGELGSAMQDFDAAAQLKPDLGEAWVNRGSALIRQRRFAEGVSDIEKGLALGTSKPERAYFNRGVAREWLDDPQGAYEDYRQAARLNPAWEEPQAMMARFTVTRKDG